VVEDYPEYVEIADNALKYINEELTGSKLAALRAELIPPSAPVVRRKPDADESAANVSSQPNEQSVKTPDKEKRARFLSAFRFKSWGKSSKGRSKNTA
jgi:hypothetical protein